MSAPVFLAEPAELARLSAGDTYVLSGPEGHHAAVVQRRGVGEKIDIVDAVGRRAHARVTEVDGRELVVVIDDIYDEQAPRPHVTIVQGLVKSGAEEAVATMTEVGVDTVIPWQSHRSIAKWSGERGVKARDKWQASAREAAKQSRRAFVPEVRGVVQNKNLAELIEKASAGAGGALVLIAHEEAEVDLGRVDGLKEAREVVCVIGPEGGISADEAALFEEAGGVLVSLGPTVLRAITAGTVATVLIRAAAN